MSVHCGCSFSFTYTEIGRAISSSTACAGKDDDGSLFSDDGEDHTEHHRRRREQIQDILKGDSAKVHDWTAEEKEPATDGAQGGSAGGSSRSTEDVCIVRDVVASC